VPEVAGGEPDKSHSFREKKRYPDLVIEVGPDLWWPEQFWECYGGIFFVIREWSLMLMRFFSLICARILIQIRDKITARKKRNHGDHGIGGFLNPNPFY